MNILLIGGSGKIGSALINLLLKKVNHINIDVLSKNYSEFSIQHDNVNLIKFDRRDYNIFYNTFKDKHYDVVVDFIGYVQEDIDNFMQTFYNTHTQYIYISSFQVYSLLDKIGIMFEHELDLSSIEKIINNIIPSSKKQVQLYALEKLKCEYKIIQRCSETSNINYTILRPSRIYSKEDDKCHLNWIKKRLINDTPIVLNKSILLENHYFNPIYIDDLAMIIFRCIGNESCYNEVFNVSQNEIISYYDLIIYSYRSYNKPFEFEILDESYFKTPLLQNYVIPAPENLILCNNKINNIVKYDYTKTIDWTKDIIKNLKNNDNVKLNNYINEKKFILQYRILKKHIERKLDNIKLVK